MYILLEQLQAHVGHIAVGARIGAARKQAFQRIGDERQRLQVEVDLLDLDEEALVTILTEPKNALVKQYQRLFEIEDTQLTFTDDALLAIAKRAIERKTGARGLRSILEDILLNTMFDLPGMDSVTEVVVNEEAVTSDAAPLMIHADAEKEPATAG